MSGRVRVSGSAPADRHGSRRDASARVEVSDPERARAVRVLSFAECVSK
jgi:hypothetical protein